MYSKFFAGPDLAPNLLRLRKQAMANMYFTSGSYFLEGGDARKAAEAAWRAVSVYPALLLHPKMVHKLLYCVFGSTRGYGALRTWLKPSA
jgi:hypothetical protein